MKIAVSEWKALKKRNKDKVITLCDAGKQE
jgi:hypothetical protein